MAGSPDDADPREPDFESDRRPPAGPLESLFQEAVRRATGLGLSGLASTEEAVRRAVGEHGSPEWSRFFSEQGEELRRVLAEKMAAELGDFLRSEEVRKQLRALLEDYEIDLKVRFTRKDE